MKKEYLMIINISLNLHKQKTNKITVFYIILDYNNYLIDN